MSDKKLTMTFEDWEKRVLDGSTYPKGEPEQSKACFRCMKYYDKACGGDFPPSCGMTYDYQLWRDLKDGLYEHLTEEELEDLKIDEDPVLWAKVYLGWEARWYQAEILRCSSKKKVLRIGRRAGKTATLCVSMLYESYMKRGVEDPNKVYKVLVVCPSDAQLTVIWEAINLMIANSPFLTARVARKYQAPTKTLQFTNNSQIRMMVANDNIRGQDADLIILDEADFAKPAIIESLGPIIMTSPNVKMIASSTPTGAPGTPFRKYCEDKSLGFKEFHFPSHVLPHYDVELESYFRGLYSDAQYDHEVRADFGSIESAVFRTEYINACFEQYVYNYDDCSYHNPKGEFRIMGVDWNEVAGVHIVICRWNSEKELFQLERKYIIQDKEFTMTKGVRKILELQQAWKCDYIYVDAGAGAMAVETILQHGDLHPHLGLRKRVKKVYFGGTVEIYVPGTGAVKKPIKPLIVGLATRRVEDLMVAFPQEEARDVSAGSDGPERNMSLKEQMQKFEIIRYTELGNPIYSQNEDHTLVAWMCAVYGFVCETTGLLKPAFDPKAKPRYISSLTSDKAALIERNKVLNEVRKDMLESVAKSGSRTDIHSKKVNKDNLPMERNNDGSYGVNVLKRPMRFSRRTNVPIETRQTGGDVLRRNLVGTNRRSFI